MIFPNDYNMSNIQILLGSPRKKGNTSYLAQKLKESLSEKFQADISYLSNLNLQACTDCRNCKKGDLICTVKDDMQPLYAKMDQSDVLIFGTPIYWFGPSAQMKLLIDRLRPYYGNKKLKGKKAALILPAGTGEADCDLTIEMFKRTFDALGIENLGAVTSKAYDIGDAEKDDKALNEIKQLAARINAINRMN